jgi:chemotaxis signal transduction protein
VTEIAPDQIERREAVKSLGRRSMVTGMGKRASGVSFILDVPALLDIHDEGTTAAAAAP